MILMYHKIYPESTTEWWVDVDNFYRQMCEIGHKEVVYLDDYEPENPDHIVITFDGIYKNVIDYAVPILEKFSYPFELFVIGEMIGKDNSFDTSEPLTQFASHDDLEKVIARGGRIQWHTKTHPNLKETEDKSLIKDEITVPGKIKKLDKKGFDWFAYPNGDFNETVKKEVSKLYKGALSCNQGNDKDRYTLNRVTVVNNSSFKKAKIGVVIPSYNYGHYLPEAVESVLKQTRLPDKILISDDSSEDNTQEIGEFYADEYPELISYNCNKKNLGIIKHFDKAAKLLDTDYIVFLGADNRLRSDYIEKCASVLDKEDDVGVVYTNFALFDKRAPAVYEDLPEEWHSGQKGGYYLINFPDFTDESRKLLKKRNFMHGTSMYRKNAWKEVGGYSGKKDKRPEDHSLFLRIVESGWEAKRVSEPLLEYRQHSRDQVNINFGLTAQLSFYKSNYKRLERELKEVTSELNRIKSSKFWKLLNVYKNPRTAIPHYTRELVNKVVQRIGL